MDYFEMFCDNTLICSIVEYGMDDTLHRLCSMYMANWVVYKLIFFSEAKKINAASDKIRYDMRATAL